MENQNLRTEILIGENKVEILKKSKVCIFGLGGVGSYVVEALARSGIENFILIDDDKVDITNINRQIIALHSTIGAEKVEIAKKRIVDINPNANVKVYSKFFLKDDENIIDSSISYIVDAIDTVSAKVEIAKIAENLNIPIISIMGTGNKLDPTLFEVTDIYKTQVCPLAKVMRKLLKENNVKHLKVVYSKEIPIKQCESKVPGSISFVPSVAGLIAAGEVIKDIIK